MNILVVEDDPVLKAVLKHFFSLKGHEVIEASDGRQGLQILAQRKLPELIITDIMMPHMNGYEMIAEIKSHEDLQDIPLIIITAGKIDLEKYTASGANEIFQKPLPLHRLLKKAEELVSAAYPELKK